MASDSVLAFEMLDRHVIHGNSDRVACADASGSLTFAQLLERSAALAGGLAILGLTAGDQVDIAMPTGNDRVIVACAVIRLGVLPGDDDGVRIGVVDDVPVVQLRGPDGELSHELSLVERAGRSEPAPALTADLPGYVDAVHPVFADIVGPLRTGSQVV